MPATIVERIYKIAKVIYEQAVLAKGNHKQITRLSERVSIVVSTIENLEELPRTTNFREALLALEQKLIEIKDFIEQFTKTHWIKKFFLAKSYHDRFPKFAQDLAELLAQLSVGLTAQHLINSEQDRLDENEDREFVHSRIEEILAQQERTFRAVQEAYIDPTELEALIKRQLRSLSLQIEQYVHPRPIALASAPLSRDRLVNFYDVEFEHRIGQGRFGVIYKGRWREQVVAVKLIDGVATEADYRQFTREAQIMSRLHSEYIAQLRGACLEKGRFCLLIEWMEKGDLDQNLTALSLSERLEMAKNLAAGLHYFHEQGIIHGDIKPKNVLINRHNQAKWADFGLSKTLQMSIASLDLTSHEARWQAPESWQDRHRLTPASDSYSFGMLLWTLVTGKQPYPDLSNDEAIMVHVQQGHREQLPENFPEPFRELLMQCWSDNPTMRPTSLEIVRAVENLAPDMFTGPPRPLSPDGETLYQQGMAAHHADKPDVAYALYQRAAQKECAKAFTNLGLFSLEGFRSQPANKALAKEYLERGIAGGHGRAAFNLARMYERADGVDQSYEEALKLYRKTLELDPKFERARSKITYLEELLASSAQASASSDPLVAHPQQ